MSIPGRTSALRERVSYWGDVRGANIRACYFCLLAFWRILKEWEKREKRSVFFVDIKIMEKRKISGSFICLFGLVDIKIVEKRKKGLSFSCFLFNVLFLVKDVKRKGKRGKKCFFYVFLIPSTLFGEGYSEKNKKKEKKLSVVFVFINLSNRFGEEFRKNEQKRNGPLRVSYSIYSLW